MVLLSMGIPVLDQKRCAENRYSSVDLEIRVGMNMVKM